MSSFSKPKDEDSEHPQQTSIKIGASLLMRQGNRHHQDGAQLQVDSEHQFFISVDYSYIILYHLTSTINIHKSQSSAIAISQVNAI